jgi:cadherin 5 type 2 (VE-cadherin)
LLKIQGESSRIIRHFHFNTWPDFGVPDPPTTLIRFVRSFRDRVSTDAHKPIVVHCSAGVGRSGTFIALDRLIQQMQVSQYFFFRFVMNDTKQTIFNS